MLGAMAQPTSAGRNVRLAFEGELGRGQPPFKLPFLGKWIMGREYSKYSIPL